MNIQNVAQLLGSAGQIVKHQKEIAALRGENFNIFSILGMESKENATHSAFLGELLNPKGSHLKGACFLDLFLKVVGHSPEFKSDSAQLILEHYIGPRDDAAKTGGRIDIFLRDPLGNSISIENKIYAVDQYAQVERYYKYNQARNKVYYLTLFGVDPSEDSKGKLISSEHFIPISYSTHILDWLQLCLQASVESPLLRESIKQYILLIKKLTGNMQNQANDEMTRLILSNFENAHYVSANMKDAHLQFNETIRQEVIQLLTEKYKESELTVIPGADSKNKYSQIFIRFKAFPNTSLHFGIETFSVDSLIGGKLYVGICNFDRGDKDFAQLEGNRSTNGGYWISPRDFSELEGYAVNLGQAKVIQHLYNDQAFKSRFIAHIVEETAEYIKEKGGGLLAYLKEAAAH